VNVKELPEIGNSRIGYLLEERFWEKNGMTAMASVTRLTYFFRIGGAEF